MRQADETGTTTLDYGMRANLSGTNLFASRLVSSSLAGAKLAGANLNGAWLMGTTFAGADLSGSSMLGLVILGGQVRDKPNFAGANLSGVRMIADLPGADLGGADLSQANLGVDIRNQGMGQMRTDLSGAKLTGANLRDTNLNRAVMMFADLSGANLTGANLFRAKLSGADLTGADVAGADLTEADLDGTILKNVKGIDAAKGMDKATNRAGRPPIPPELRSLIRRMAAENPLWGEERIANELLVKLGIRVSPRTVGKYIPKRPPGQPRGDQRGSTFLKNHAKAILACDFFVAVTATFRMLYLFVVIEHGTRRLAHVNVTAQPSADWTLQQLWAVVGEDSRQRYLIHDRDKIFAKHLDDSIRALGIDVLRSPVAIRRRTRSANA